MYAPPAVGYALIVCRYERIKNASTTRSATAIGTTIANAEAPVRLRRPQQSPRAIANITAAAAGSVNPPADHRRLLPSSAAVRSIAESSEVDRGVANLQPGSESGLKSPAATDKITSSA